MGKAKRAGSWQNCLVDYVVLCPQVLSEPAPPPPTPKLQKPGPPSDLHASGHTQMLWLYQDKAPFLRN